MNSLGPKWSLAKVVLSAVVLAVFCRLFVVGIYKVPTSSMLPNLYVGDVILAWRFPFSTPGKFTYRLFTGSPVNIERGDMIVFRHPKSDAYYVKRVIALPGDSLQIRDGSLSINRKAAKYEPTNLNSNFMGHEYYQSLKETSSEYSISILRRKQEIASLADVNNFQLSMGEYFVMGDNRDSSDDSRDWGAVPGENIEGLVSRVLFSVDWQSETSAKMRWSRVLLPVGSED